MSAPCATFAMHHTLAAASDDAPTSHVAVSMPACVNPHARGVTEGREVGVELKGVGWS